MLVVDVGVLVVDVVALVVAGAAVTLAAAALNDNNSEWQVATTKKSAPIATAAALVTSSTRRSPQLSNIVELQGYQTKCCLLRRFMICKGQRFTWAKVALTTYIVINAVVVDGRR